jgi:hypothetical protein
VEPGELDVARGAVALLADQEIGLALYAVEVRFGLPVEWSHIWLSPTLEIILSMVRELVIFWFLPILESSLLLAHSVVF